MPRLKTGEKHEQKRIKKSGLATGEESLTTTKNFPQVFCGIFAFLCYIRALSKA
jgi:hypothetical protein